MTADRGTLQRAADHARAALLASRMGSALAHQTGAASVVVDALQRAGDESSAVLKALGTIGIAPTGFNAQALSDGVPLALLDLPEARELLDRLRELLPLAEAIDARRGRALDKVVGGSAGMDVAEDLVQLIARLELDTSGPKGSGLE